MNQFLKAWLSVFKGLPFNNFSCRYPVGTNLLIRNGSESFNAVVSSNVLTVWLNSVHKKSLANSSVVCQKVQSVFFFNFSGNGQRFISVYKKLKQLVLALFFNALLLFGLYCAVPFLLLWKLCFLKKIVTCVLKSCFFVFITFNIC